MLCIETLLEAAALVCSFCVDERPERNERDEWMHDYGTCPCCAEEIYNVIEELKESK